MDNDDPNEGYAPSYPQKTASTSDWKPAYPATVNMQAEETPDLNSARDTSAYETGNPGYKYHYKKDDNEIFSNTLPDKGVSPVVPVNPAEDFGPRTNQDGSPITPVERKTLNEFNNASAETLDWLNRKKEGFTQKVLHARDYLVNAGYASAGRPAPGQDEDDLRNIANRQTQNYDQYVKDQRDFNAPLRNSPGGRFGEVAADVGTALAAPGGIVTQAGVQGAINGLDPTVGDESSLGNAGRSFAGGMVGGAAARGFTKLLQPFSSKLDSKGLDAINILRKNGINSLDLAQATGNKTAQSIKAATEDAPLIGQRNWEHAVQKPEVTNAVLTRYAGLNEPETQAALAARSVGSKQVDTEGASPDIMSAARDGANNVRNQVFNRNPIELHMPMSQMGGQSLNDTLKDIWSRTGQEVSGPHAADPVRDIITKLRSEALQNNGTIPTNVFQSMREEASDLALNPQLKRYGGELGEAMDSALAHQETVPGDALRLFTANQRLSNLHVISKAVDDDNQIPLATLKKVMDKPSTTEKTVYGRGTKQQQDLWELAQAGNRIMPGRMANSQTARRLAGLALPLGLLGAGEGLYHGDWKTAAEFGAAGLAAPLIGNSLMYGMPRAYATAMAKSPLVTSGVNLMNRAGSAYGASGAAPKEDTSSGPLLDSFTGNQ